MTATSSDTGGRCRRGMGATTAMTNCPWEAIDGFLDSREFDRFRRWMEDRVAAGAARRVPVVGARYSIVSLEEVRFQHVESGEIWRLVSPDPPFTGVFERVPSSGAWSLGEIFRRARERLARGRAVG